MKFYLFFKPEAFVHSAYILGSLALSAKFPVTLDELVIFRPDYRGACQEKAYLVYTKYVLLVPASHTTTILLLSNFASIERPKMPTLDLGGNRASARFTSLKAQ